MCLPAGAWWGWDKGRTTEWQWSICKVRTGGSRFNSHRVCGGRERTDQIPVMSWLKPETFVLSFSALQMLLRQKTPITSMLFSNSICWTRNLLLLTLKLQSFQCSIMFKLTTVKLWTEKKELQDLRYNTNIFECGDSFTTDLKGHVLPTNYTFMAENPERPQGPLCLMLAPCCLDKAGWLESDYEDKESDSD